MTYGDDTQTVILLNMSEGCAPTQVVVMQVAYIVVAILTFPLMMFPASRTLEKPFFREERRSGKKWAKNLLRMFLCGASLTVAYLAGGEHLGNMVALIGGACCVPLAMIYPPLFHWKIQKPERPFVNFSYLSIGTLAGIIASVLAVLTWAKVVS